MDRLGEGSPPLYLRELCYRNVKLSADQKEAVGEQQRI